MKNNYYDTPWLPYNMLKQQCLKVFLFLREKEEENIIAFGKKFIP
jgi:hypothetical protein